MHDDDDQHGDSGPRSDEDEAQRVDRELIELLNELRVVMPGVQLLFAFLLTVPFQQNFSKATSFQKDVYLVTLLLTAMASALLIAPSAYHRLQFRQDDKKHIVFIANKFSIAGFAVLAAAMTSAVLLVTDFQRDVYFVALVSAAIATALLIAPAAQHRLLFRQKEKEALLHRSSRSAFAGTLVLAVAVVAALLLVVDVFFSRPLAWATAGGVAALLLWWWVAVPLWQRAHHEQEPLGP